MVTSERPLRSQFPTLYWISATVTTTQAISRWLCALGRSRIGAVGGMLYFTRAAGARVCTIGVPERPQACAHRMPPPMAPGATARYLRNGQRRAKVLRVTLMASAPPYSKPRAVSLAVAAAVPAIHHTDEPPSSPAKCASDEWAHGVPNRVAADVDPRRRGAPARRRRWPGSTAIGGSDAIVSSEKDLFLFQSCNCCTARGMVGGPYPSRISMFGCWVDKPPCWRFGIPFSTCRARPFPAVRMLDHAAMRSQRPIRT